MLKRFADISGNTFKGFGMSYSGNLQRHDDEDADIEDLSLNINDSMANMVHELMESNSEIRRTIAYNKIRILRGSHDSLEHFVQDDIHSHGYFAVKRGESVQDHLQLVDLCREEYSKTIDDMEKLRIGTKEVECRTLVEGKPFVFEFPSRIDNLTLLSKEYLTPQNLSSCEV